MKKSRQQRKTHAARKRNAKGKQQHAVPKTSMIDRRRSMDSAHFHGMAMAVGAMGALFAERPRSNTFAIEDVFGLVEGELDRRYK